MTSEPSRPEVAVDRAALKQQIREQAHENRRQQEDKDGISSLIMQRFMELPEYQAARTVMFYIDVRAEVRTRNDLERALAGGKKIVVPYCVDGELELFHLEAMDELEIGMYRILEPRAELREVAEKQVDVTQLDLIMVPGVAFDRRGDGPVTARATTTSCSSMPAPRRRWSPSPSIARCSTRSRWSRTTSSWTRS
jgi:5-formyltetrahydrofolate cyclo-ligase